MVRRKPEDVKLPRGLWDPIHARGPRTELRERQWRKLKYVLEHAYNNNPFYQGKFIEAGIHPDKIKSFQDFLSIPVTTRTELNEVQAKAPLFGDHESPDYPAWRPHQTSGTTGRNPLYMGPSQISWNIGAHSFAESWYNQGFRCSDYVAICGPAGLFLGLNMLLDGLAYLRTPYMHTGALDTKNKIRTCLRYGVNALSLCTPTLLQHWLNVAKEMGIDMAEESKIVKISSFGEPLFPSAKNLIEEGFGAKVTECWGVQELGVITFSCPSQTEGEVKIPDVYLAHAMHIKEDYLYWEVLNPDTWEPCDYGEKGALVATSFAYCDATPFIRYVVGDVTSKLPYDLCSCGSTYDLTSGVLGRIDHALKIRGVLFYPPAIEKTVRDHTEIDEYQLIIWRNKEGQDELTLKIDFKPHLNPERKTFVRNELINALRVAFGLRFDVQEAQPGEIPRFELKAIRFKDLRTKG